MKANELRIGNYLVNFLGQEFQVNIETLRLLDEGGIGSEFPLPNPIRLTEEKLLKFGFEKNKTSCFCHVNSGLELMNISNKYFRAYYRKVPIKKDLIYDHQLQNLCFALIGEELEITN